MTAGYSCIELHASRGLLNWSAVRSLSLLLHQFNRLKSTLDGFSFQIPPGSGADSFLLLRVSLPVCLLARESLI